MYAFLLSRKIDDHRHAGAFADFCLNIQVITVLLNIRKTHTGTKSHLSSEIRSGGPAGHHRLINIRNTGARFLTGSKRTLKRQLRVRPGLRDLRTAKSAISFLWSTTPVWILTDFRSRSGSSTRQTVRRSERQRFAQVNGKPERLRISDPK